MYPEIGIAISRVEQIEGQVKILSADGLMAFREWFMQFDAEIWDRQIEIDATNGKLLALADRALRDHDEGHSTEL